MSIATLLDDVRFLKNLGDRRAEADRLLLLADEEGSLPTGNIQLHSDGSYRFFFEGGEFFKKLRALYGKNCRPSPIFKEFQRRFQRNSAAALKLGLLDSEQRKLVKNHHWPPFAEGLPELLQRVAPDMPLFTSARYIASGTYGDVYRLDSADGPFALKIYHPPAKIGDCGGYLFSPIPWSIQIAEILRNLYDKKDYISRHNELLRLMYVTDSKKISAERSLSLWEYCPGKSVAALPDLSEEEKARVIMQFGGFLSKIHKESYFVGDMHWNNVLLDNDDVRVCDADTLCTGEELNFSLFYPNRILCPHYASRQRMLSGFRTAYSELEGFALMVDRLMLGEPWITCDNLSFHLAAAEKNEREYPPERRAALSNHMGEIITSVLRYPQDLSITIDHFLDAARRDFS